jgi:hypothetical protein
MSDEVLRFGSSSDLVVTWQNFLRGYHLDSRIVVSGRFDQQTFKETKEFQVENKLFDDGVVGDKTFEAAKKFGFEFKEVEDILNPGLVPISFSERLKLFGQFSYVSQPSSINPEGIRITDDWISKNIVTVNVSQLKGVKGVSNTGSILLHKKISKQVVDMFAEFEKNNLLHLIKTFDGSWNPRYVRGSRTSLSNHSWGTAIDLNARWNGLGTVGARMGCEGSVRELVLIAVDHGMYWGGWFSRKDPMHFEACRCL